MAITLVIVVPLFVLGMWFSDRISGYVVLQAWSSTGPRQALKARDVNGVRQLAAGPVECGTDETGQFTVKLAGGPQKGPRKPAGVLMPSVPAADAKLEYDLANAEVKAEVPSEAGRQVTYVLVRRDGAWKVKMALPSGVPGQ
jgi:hypothetical protein